MKRILFAVVMLGISGLAFSESIRALEKRPLNVMKNLGLPIEAQQGFVWTVVPVDEQGRAGQAVWRKSGKVSSEFMELAKQKIASFERFKPKWVYAHTLKGYHKKLKKVQEQKCAAIDPDRFKQWNDNPHIAPDLIGKPLLDCLHKVSDEQANIKVNIPSVAQFFIISEKQAMVNIAQIYLPRYPALSAENGEEGSVVTELHIAGGKVDTAKIVKSSGYSRLDNAARKAIWRLTVSKKAREDIEYYHLIHFNLGD